MQKNVQIPYDLFIDLIRFHLLDFYEDEKKIKTGLERKLMAMSDRQFYSKYKTAETESEREARPLLQPGYRRVLVTAPLRSHSRKNPLQMHEIAT